MAGYLKREPFPEEVRRIKSAYGFRSDFQNSFESEVECMKSNVNLGIRIRFCDQNLPKDSVWKSVDPNVPSDSCRDYLSCFCVQANQKRMVTRVANGFQDQEIDVARETGAIRKQVIFNAPTPPCMPKQILSLESFR